MDVIEWLSANARFMVVDRPDVYDFQTAIEELSVCLDLLRENDDRPVSTVSFTSYVLTRIVEDDVEEFILSRKMSGVMLFGAEEECAAYSYHPQVDLPDVLDDDDYR